MSLLRGCRQWAGTSRTRVDVGVVAFGLLRGVAYKRCPSRLELEKRVGALVQEFLEFSHIPADADTLHRPRHAFEIVCQRFVAAKVGWDVGDEHGASRDRVDEMQRERLTGLNKAVKVTVKEREAEQGKHVGEDQVQCRTGFRIDDEIVECRWGRRGSGLIATILCDGGLIARRGANVPVGGIVRKVWIGVD